MLTVVLGLAALARPLPFARRVRGYALWSAVAGGLAALAVAGGVVGRWQGGLLVAAYLAGVALLWRRERQPPAIGEAGEASEEDGGARPAAAGLALALGGVALMAGGGWLAIAAAALPLALLAVTPSGRLNRLTGAGLVIGYGAWVTAVLAR